jgi:hypothetical protein
LLLVIIFVFDPLAIALVIAANFAFAQLRNKEILSDKDEIDIPEKDWDEDWPDDNDQDLETASLEDLEKWEKDEEEPYQIYVSGSQSNKPNQDWEIIDEEKEHEKEIKSQNGVPVMINPKTGKFYYEEQEPEPEIIYKNLDLNNDGVVDENELKQAFNKADLNNDGVIDENEAKLANLDPNTVLKLNQLNNQVDSMIDNFQQYYRFNPEELKKIKNQINEIKKLSIELSSSKNKNRDDDNTITYF